MSNNFPDQNRIAKLSNTGKNDNYFHPLNEGVDIDDLTLSYDHMYASSNSVINGIESTEDNCQSSEDNEVKFLKDWLVIHLDLIQQQNDEILNKDKTIFILKQENEKLKERLLFIEKDISVQNNQVINNHKDTEIISETLNNDMTQDLTTIDEVDSKAIEEGISSAFHFEGDEEKKLNFTITNHIEEENKLNIITESEESIKNKEIIKSPDHMNDLDTLAKYEGSYTVHNSIENNSMKNLKMSIRRKRLCSNSSVFSNDTVSDDKKNYRRSRKRRKDSFDPDHIMSCNDQYVTHAGETNYSITNPLDLTNDLPANSNASNLEVPRWRIKSYTSCYTMEGTENLEDDAFNKRHARLEYDERRRKRWDVQRIREQRVIEKLKLRQEKIGSGSRNEDTTPLETLLPTLDDIKYIEVCDMLPVSAFGSPLTKFQYSEFSLPWLNNPNSGTRRGISKRQRAKRRVNSKR
ncbi:male-specific lethal 1 homolog [Onthophagus taurus]|uniref:male-specific lethal 1 homolog n=1 Tax=Onthophagus taurus TaxID=166361 RepID=UPI000C20DB86|nr:male-specific lethal 1 homolog [Onthophagus taurus]